MVSETPNNLFGLATLIFPKVTFQGRSKLHVAAQKGDIQQVALQRDVEIARCEDGLSHFFFCLFVMDFHSNLCMNLSDQEDFEAPGNLANNFF